jgi:hypothetical protein
MARATVPGPGAARLGRECEGGASARATRDGRVVASPGRRAANVTAASGRVGAPFLRADVTPSSLVPPLPHALPHISHSVRPGMPSPTDPLMDASQPAERWQPVGMACAAHAQVEPSTATRHSTKKLLFACCAP